MASFNQWIGLGNMTRDVELKYTPSGMAVASFGVACNSNWTDSKTGEKKEEVFFADCECWGKTAENLAQYARKGSQIHVSGRLKTEEWDDKTTGQKRSKIKVVVQTFQLCGSKADNAGTAQPSSAAARAATRPPGASERYQSPDLPKQTAPVQDDTDDVPF